MLVELRLPTLQGELPVRPRSYRDASESYRVTEVATTAEKLRKGVIANGEARVWGHGGGEHVFFFGQLGEHVELQQHCNLPSSAVRYRWGDGLMIFNYYIFR